MTARAVLTTGITEIPVRIQLPIAPVLVVRGPRKALLLP